MLSKNVISLVMVIKMPYGPLYGARHAHLHENVVARCWPSVHVHNTSHGTYTMPYCGSFELHMRAM